jgi:hypothetical protein
MVSSDPLTAPQMPAFAGSVESDPLRNAQSIPPSPFASMVTSRKARKSSDRTMAMKPMARKRRSDA